MAMIKDEKMLEYVKMYAEDQVGIMYLLNICKLIEPLLICVPILIFVTVGLVFYRFC